MDNNLDNVNYIVNTYSDMIYRLAYQNTFNKSEAEDITQEVFMAMLKKIPFKSEEHMRAWLVRVVINKSKDYLKSKRRKVLPLDEHCEISVTDRNIHDRIEEIDKLPPLDRQVIYLFYYEGYSAKEIAKMTGKTRNAVNIRLSRARENLRILIEEGEGND